MAEKFYIVRRGDGQRLESKGGFFHESIIVMPLDWATWFVRRIPNTRIEQAREPHGFKEADSTVLSTIQAQIMKYIAGYRKDKPNLEPIPYGSPFDYTTNAPKGEKEQTNMHSRIYTYAIVESFPQDDKKPAVLLQDFTTIIGTDRETVEKRIYMTVVPGLATKPTDADNVSLVFSSDNSIE